MNEKPILFSGPMVNAILSGAKTVTRRVIKPQPERTPAPCYWVKSGWALEGQPNEHGGPNGCSCQEVKCPYGKPGSRLWVRETFFDHGDMPGVSALPLDARVEYRATPWDRQTYIKGEGWKPSIFMPRWASRITLEIVSVGVERLQEISADDAVAEGMADCRCGGFGEIEQGGDSVACPECKGNNIDVPVENFRELWDEINGKRAGCSWKDSPWVWVIGFKRV